ncbi:LEUCINE AMINOPEPTIDASE-RELATED [Salix purpurea]|uniref:LEUCINE AMINOPEPTIDASE-RELATED n=1 Tax=Salix purpurea TaxID=77065 RepID=A0A9Q0T1J0_SALPP|nr:LEUCINE AMINOPEPTIDASE-RELATED [Salix purpurea]
MCVDKIALSAKEIDVAEWKGDILAVGVTKKDMTKDDSKRFENSLLKNLDTKLGGHLSEASSEEDFTGKPGQSIVLRVPRRLQLLQRMLKPVMLALCLPFLL